MKSSSSALTVTYSECTSAPPSHLCRCRWRRRPRRHTFLHSCRDPSHTCCSWLKGDKIYGKCWRAHVEERFHDSQGLTCVTGAAPPAWGAGAHEGVAMVEACAPVTAGGRIALAHTWRDITWLVFVHTIQKVKQARTAASEGIASHGRDEQT